MNKHRVFILLTAAQGTLLAVLLLHGQMRVAAGMRQEIPALQQVVRALCLTDLAIWTEARYTRHPSQADRFTPFQDFPSALEHFPAGSIIGPVNAAGQR